MMVLITYDVSTMDQEGQKRLKQVAKKCQSYGQRVQGSVFECLLEPAMLIDIKESLKEIINDTTDTIRFYNLGGNWKEKIDCIGVNHTYDPCGPLII